MIQLSSSQHKQPNKTMAQQKIQLLTNSRNYYCKITNVCMQAVVIWQELSPDNLQIL